MDGLPGHTYEDLLKEPNLIIPENEWNEATDAYEEALSDFYEWADTAERLDSLIEENEDLNELNRWDSE